MAEFGLASELPVGETDKDKKKKPRRRGFLLSWLKAREAGDNDETQEDRAEKPRKGLVALLRRLFAKHVDLEAVEAPKTKDTTQEEAEDTPAWRPKTEQPGEAVATADQAEAASPAGEAVPADPDDEPIEKTRERPAAEIKETEETEEAKETEETEEARVPIDTADALPAPLEPEEPVRIVRRGRSGVVAAGPAGSPAAVETKASKPATGADSRRDQLMAGALAGSVAERLGRQEKDQRRQAEHLNAAEQKLSRRVERAEARIAELTQENRAELTPSEEPTLHRSSPEPEQPMAGAGATAEKFGTDIAQARQAMAEEFVKKVEAYERQQAAPEAVLNEMIKAAEVDAPVERVYERRQEIKNKSGGPARSVPASVASIISNMPEPRVKFAANYGLSAPAPAARGHNPSHHSPDPHLYKQAVQGGFWGAVVIVIFILMVYLFA